MSVMPNQAISASAGSGKTYQLALRYVELLASGVKPDRIIAITFTRKAAGEIFGSVVTQLLKCATSQEEARKVALKIGLSDFSTHYFSDILRQLFDNLHKINISTIDSFVVGITRAFSSELGLPVELQIVEPKSAQAGEMQKTILSQLLDFRNLQEDHRQAFFAAFKQATFGVEEKISTQLDNYVRDYREQYLLLPQQRAWGDASMIWPKGTKILDRPHNLLKLIAEAIGFVQNEKFPGKLQLAFERFINFAGNYNEFSLWNKKVASAVVFKHFLGKLTEETAGLDFYYFKKKYTLNPQFDAVMQQLVRNVVAVELNKTLQRTSGLFHVLDFYEKYYDQLIHRQGILTFADAQHLLAGTDRDLSGIRPENKVAADERLYIDFRLDCQLDHWLIDEFQDTSDLQWSILENLIAEVVQDNSGQRSFFYVGDIKQAIYGWRGGNPELFGRLLKEYEGGIEQQFLATSYRSCTPVIQTVNRVFSKVHVAEISPKVADKWDGIWHEHLCSKDKALEQGYAAIIEPPANEQHKPDVSEINTLCADLINEIYPLKRDLSVGILVRTNNAGSTLVDTLRSKCNKIKITYEDDRLITDNPVVSLLLALIKYAAHPGDSLACRHLQMSPLSGALSAQECSWHDLPTLLLYQIHNLGFCGFISTWGAELEQAIALDNFGRKRLDQLQRAAAEFDGLNRRDCDAFLRFINSFQIQDTATAGAVRVMTIHKSKGLGFDIVILPDLMGLSISHARKRDLILKKDAQTSMPVWGLKNLKIALAGVDKTIAAAVQEHDEQASFENLCLLYVALTRAKRGLYMLTSYPGASAKALSSGAFLKKQLNGNAKALDGSKIEVSGNEYICLYETGRRDWYKTIEAGTRHVHHKKACLPSSFVRQSTNRKRLAHVLPSSQVLPVLSGTTLFTREFSKSKEIGTAIHALFEKITWLGEFEPDEIISQWQQTAQPPEHIREAVMEQFRAVLDYPEIRRVLTKPADNLELWRERRFNVIIGKKLINGCFDRVEINTGSACVYDYKTGLTDMSKTSQVLAHYRPQLELYRQALAKITGLAIGDIKGKIIFTQLGLVCE